MLIQANIDAPCTCLDFPSLNRFIEEIRNNDYDIVGISSIAPNFHKVKKMCDLIREHLPDATIVVGGHVANMPGLNRQIEADYIVQGDGIRWLRRFLGEDESKPIRHPLMRAGFGLRAVGLNVPTKALNIQATLIPGVGCPIGCNFCSTSAMFGGKGKFVNFYETGDELFDIMCQLEKQMKVRGFFVMDENFLLHRRRALKLLELMRENEKSWELSIFSSADVLKMYTMEQLVGLGVSWIWLGLEGKDSQYGKLKDADTRSLVRTLQSHGIRVLGSSIIGLEEHTPDNIDEAIDYAVSHDTDFHQFMLYMPMPGTPLHSEMSAKGVMLDDSEIDIADVHGQCRFNYRHPHIKPGDETKFLLRAFRRDFEVNGPSILRYYRGPLAGWKRYKNHPERRIRKRFAIGIEGIASVYAGMAWAARRCFKNNSAIFSKSTAWLEEVYSEFGLKARLGAQLIGRAVSFLLRREEKRLAKGRTREPPTFYERNYKETNPTTKVKKAARQIRWVVPHPPLPIR